LYPSGKPDRLLRLERHHGEREAGAKRRADQRPSNVVTPRCQPSAARSCPLSDVGRTAGLSWDNGRTMASSPYERGPDCAVMCCCRDWRCGGIRNDLCRRA
jgi:hypothetical protein